MSEIQIVGSYRLDRNENLDAFYTAAGVPWIARKVMLTTSPEMIVSKGEGEDEDDCWLFKTVTFLRTIEQSFKIDEPFEETMPSGDVFTTTAKMEGDDKFVLHSTSDDDKGEFHREYKFSGDNLTITLKHPSGVEAKRYFKRSE